MTSCIFHIVVDRMIVSRNRLKGGGVCTVTVRLGRGKRRRREGPETFGVAQQ